MVSVAVGTLVGLIAAEVGARFLLPAKPLHVEYVADDPLPFKPKPWSRTSGRTDEFKYDYRHNGFGFRDVEHPLDKSDGTFRILGLGDSFTYGVGVALEETYLHRLEARLNAREGSHPRVEIVKAGMPRYFPEAERLLLEKYGMMFSPDLVVVGLLPNDVIDTFLGVDALTVESGHLVTREGKTTLGSLGVSVSPYSRLAGVVLKTYVEWRTPHTRRPDSRRHRWNEVFVSGGYHENEWIRVEQELEKMARIAGSRGARLTVMTIPQRGPWTEASRYPAARISLWARKHGVSFVDVLPAMERIPDRPRLYYPKDGHCTPAGHAVIADVLYQHLIDENLVP